MELGKGMWSGDGGRRVRAVLVGLAVMAWTSVVPGPGAPRLPAPAEGADGTVAEQVGSGLRSALADAAGFGVAWAADEPLGKRLQRLSTRTDRSMRRLGGAFVVAALVLVSSVVFLVVAAVGSAFDLRMVGRVGTGFFRALRRGATVFLRLVGSRRIPHRARIPLFVALLYWLWPFDLVSDGNLLLGFVDDIVIAIVAGKLFIALCPERLLVQQAATAAAGR